MVLLFVVCGWREEAVSGVCRRTYSVHSKYVFFCTSATISLFRAKPTVIAHSGAHLDTFRTSRCLFAIFRRNSVEFRRNAQPSRRARTNYFEVKIDDEPGGHYAVMILSSSTRRMTNLASRDFVCLRAVQPIQTTRS
jgi:hypothetical protein